jgi:NADH:ubiquinone oxidoreductase subunit E
VESSNPRDPIEPRVRAAIDDFVARNGSGAEQLVPLLHEVQERLGHLPFAVQEHVADRLGLSPVQVYGVVSFYHQFTTTPRAEHQFRVCMGTACFVRHAQRVLDALEDACGVEAGGISEDRLFNVDRVRCIGACSLAPAIQVDHDVHGNVTPAEARDIVRWLRQGATSGSRGRDEGPEEEPST